MKHLIYLLAISLAAMSNSACENKKNEDTNESDAYNEKIELSQLDSIRNELQKAIPNVPVELYRKAIAMHLQFVEYNKEDPFAPVALDYAQGYAEQLQDLRSSIMYIDRILEEYPDYKGRQMLMFNKATHHDFLRDTLEARLAYEAYLSTFPKISKEEKEEIQELIKLVPFSFEERILMNSNSKD